MKLIPVHAKCCQIYTEIKIYYKDTESDNKLSEKKLQLNLVILWPIGKNGNSIVEVFLNR